MTKISFGTRELCKCLKCLGFRSQPQKATSHVKYKIPLNHPTPQGFRPFIVVILGKKSYDPNTSSSYVTQIKRLGFTKKEIEKCFR